METRETPTAKSKRVWDKMAPSYDKQISFFEKIQFSGGREWICSRAAGNTLEVAIGTGRNLSFYPEGVQVTGIELSPAMLDIARRRAEELGVEAELREGDAENLPFADASFDTVVCALSLCTIPNHRKAISEMARVLKPGGKLLLLDHIGSRWWPIWGVQRLIELFTARAGEYMTRRPLPMLAAAGFTVTESEQLKLGTVERVAATKSA
ncbi:MAG TPA: SAM-dependent methyltransferase [Micromonosporaceae bacterium]|nr:SAM-dependent methyltransferase [Micromonosporaceae bacterium]HCU50503.1 SAM-dependent methyltransferase [Micromonosporaceae bacterium]